MDKIFYIRKIQTIISIILFICVFLFSWYVTEFSIFDIPLSYFSTNPITSSYWNHVLELLSVSLSINTLFYILKHKRLKFKLFLSLGFSLIFLCLFLTGFYPMGFLIHDITASLYFFIFPLMVFLLSFLNRKYIQYKEWLMHLVFSISTIFFPLLFLLLFKGFAIAEIFHSFCVMVWSLWLLKSND